MIYCYVRTVFKYYQRIMYVIIIMIAKMEVTRLAVSVRISIPFVPDCDRANQQNTSAFALNAHVIHDALKQLNQHVT